MWDGWPQESPLSSPIPFTQQTRSAKEIATANQKVKVFQWNVYWRMKNACQKPPSTFWQNGQGNVLAKKANTKPIRSFSLDIIYGLGKDQSFPNISREKKKIQSGIQRILWVAVNCFHRKKPISFPTNSSTPPHHSHFNIWQQPIALTKYFTGVKDSMHANLQHSSFQSTLAEVNRIVVA